MSESKPVSRRGGSKPGEYRGGRSKGTPNRPRKELVALLDERWPGWHPVVQLADVANDESLPIELRIDACKAVARHVAPTLKAVEHRGTVTTRQIIDLDSDSARAAAQSIGELIGIH